MCFGVLACETNDCTELGNCKRDQVAPLAADAAAPNERSDAGAIELDSGLTTTEAPNSTSEVLSSAFASDASAAPSTLDATSTEGDFSVVDGDVSTQDDRSTSNSQTAEDMTNALAPAVCGDGALSLDEDCDDGNVASNDGCSSTCELETAYSCAATDAPCLKFSVCGNAVADENEQCDDGNLTPGDGCSSRCILEPQFKCSGSPSTCSPATCGDGITEGSESCDDGNTRPFDGCSDRCQPEPACATSAGCVTSCGDGILGTTEQCDDGNRHGNDGCSPECEVELGFTCTAEAPPCELGLNGDCFIEIPVVYRDHQVSHPDFGPNADECIETVPDDSGGGTFPANALTTGLVSVMLGGNGRPVLANGSTGVQLCEAEPEAQLDKASYAGITQFGDWFADSASSVVLSTRMKLFNDGDGGFVNRLDASGARFPGYEIGSEEYDSEASDLCSWCFSGACDDTCSFERHNYDGSPLFFPVDTVTGPTADLAEARIPTDFGFLGWPYEGDLVSAIPEYEDLGLSRTEHNFYFTTEARTWFRFDASSNTRVEFAGNDDAWIFVNGRLAIDLGGVHDPESAAVTLNAPSASQFGLQSGQVYEIAVFHAQRRVGDSMFLLSVQMPEQVRSQCSPICGDGVLAAGEQCDNGVERNVGGYGECSQACLLDGYCGDGIINGEETCDPGPAGGPDCPPTCRDRLLP